MVVDAHLQALSDVSRRIETLLDRVRAGNADRYRQQALYLQVLRASLLPAVQRACFILATRHGGQAYASLAEPQRLALHRHLEALVQRCNSLLTVEQLAVLGAQLQRRRRQRAAAEPGFEAPAEAAVGLPQASVHLQLDPPLSADLFGAGSGAGIPGLPSLPPPAPDALARLALAASSEPRPQQDSLRPDAASADPDDPAGTLPMATLLPLPEHPVHQLQWWEHFDRALQRRLRNLSHAINIELLRIGVAPALLPVQLLDAVLAGQLEPDPAPPNLVRLPLPLPGSDQDPPAVSVGLLLRCSDLDYEEPRLRTCRQRLRLQRQELRRMAQQFRRLERRAQVLEAEQLWMEDTDQASTTGMPPA